MKKIFITISVLSLIGIVLFIYFFPKNINRNDLYYKSIVSTENIVYKTINKTELTFDIILPTNNKYQEIPTIFFVHGGNFIAGSKADLSVGRREIVDKILDEGYAIISIEYRMANEDYKLEDSIIDIKDAIRYTYSVATVYSFDTNNFGLWGVESGAYLALTVGYSSSGAFIGDYELRNYSSEVNYVIDFYGITQMESYFNINTMNQTELEETQNTFDILYGKDAFDIYNLTLEDYESIALYDPLSYISVDTVPTLIIHGILDDSIDISQSDLLESKLNEYSINFEYKKILGGIAGLTNLDDESINNINNYIVDFLDNNIKH